MFEKQSYADNGYLIKKNFFDTKLIDKVFTELQNENDVVKNKLLDLIKSGLFDKKDLAIENDKIKYLKNPQIYFSSIKHLIQSSLLELSELLIGENVYVDLIELHQKYPGASETPPHQDNFYFCLEKGQSLTAYIPLNDQNYKNGALAVLPGSHKMELDHHYSKVPGFSSGS